MKPINWPPLKNTLKENRKNLAKYIFLTPLFTDECSATLDWSDSGSYVFAPTILKTVPTGWGINQVSVVVILAFGIRGSEGVGSWQVHDGVNMAEPTYIDFWSHTWSHGWKWSQKRCERRQFLYIYNNALSKNIWTSESNGNKESRLMNGSICLPYHFQCILIEKIIPNAFLL